MRDMFSFRDAERGRLGRRRAVALGAIVLLFGGTGLLATSCEATRTVPIKCGFVGTTSQRITASADRDPVPQHSSVRLEIAMQVPQFGIAVPMSGARFTFPIPEGVFIDRIATTGGNVAATVVVTPARTIEYAIAGPIGVTELELPVIEIAAHVANLVPGTIVTWRVWTELVGNADLGTIFVETCRPEDPATPLISFTVKAANPPGTVPGSIPPGTYPPGSYPPGSYPPGTYPPGTYPTGTTVVVPPPAV